MRTRDYDVPYLFPPAPTFSLHQIGVVEKWSEIHVRDISIHTIQFACSSTLIADLYFDSFQ